MLPGVFVSRSPSVRPPPSPAGDLPLTRSPPPGRFAAADEKPDVSYADIGGMDIQKQEMREAVELPLTHFQLYKQIGIDPPRGVLMYGPPGCGKTMLAKAVAHHTTGEAGAHGARAHEVIPNCV